MHKIVWYAGFEDFEIPESQLFSGTYNFFELRV